ncbi:MAG: alpha/beta fold hydrolase [Pseudomonadota bacterium]
MRIALIPVFLLSASLLQAAPTETIFRLSVQGQEMIGTLALPEGPPAPVVLMLHGFNGARDEVATEHVPDGVFAHTADKLAAAGFASLRIDFRGSGDSIQDMSFAETTFESQIADAEAAMTHLQTLNVVNGNELFVIGWSQGGLVAAALAGRTDAPDAVALWNAVGDPVATYGGIFGPDQFARALAADPGTAVSLTLPWGETVSLNGAFFEDVSRHEPVREIETYSGALLVVQGLKDTVVLPENGDAYIAAHPGESTLWTAQMDHVFNTFAEAAMFDAVVDATISFFLEQMQ